MNKKINFNIKVKTIINICSLYLILSITSGCKKSKNVEPGTSPEQNFWIPTGAVLYGRIAQERPEDCYPIEEAAKFNLLDISQYLSGKTSRWCGSLDNPVQAIKQINPYSIILIYQFNPAEIYRGTGKWASGGALLFDSLLQVHGKGSNDIWFALGYNTGDYLVDIYYPQYIAMNLGNTNWRSFWMERTWNDLFGEKPIFSGSNLANGILVDGTVSHPYSGFPFCPFEYWNDSTNQCNGNTDHPAPYWTGSGWDISKWRTDMINFINEVVSWYKSRNKWIAFNVWKLNPDFASIFNQIGGKKLVAMEECGFVCNSFPPSINHWKERLQYLQQAKNFAVFSLNRISISQGQGIDKLDNEVIPGVRGWDVLWFAMTSFMLGYDPQTRNGYFNFTIFSSGTWQYRDCYWLDEYDPKYLNLGYPVSQAKELASGVWEREFERGWVWVNPTNQEKTVFIPNGRARILNHDNFKNPNLVNPVEQFNIKPFSGVIGIRE